MKAYQIQTASGVDALTIAELPDPQPGVGQVLIKVRATSLNYRDTAVVQGMYPGQTLPIIPLHAKRHSLRQNCDSALMFSLVHRT